MDMRDILDLSMQKLKSNMCNMDMRDILDLSMQKLKSNMCSLMSMLHMFDFNFCMVHEANLFKSETLFVVLIL
jgi:hypothetical protein